MGTPSLLVPRDPQPCLQLSRGNRLRAELRLQQPQPPRMASASCGSATSRALGFLWERDAELCPSFLSQGRRWEPALVPAPCPPLWSCSRTVWPCRRISELCRMQHPPNRAPHTPCPGRPADSPNNCAADKKTLKIHTCPTLSMPTVAPVPAWDGRWMGAGGAELGVPGAWSLPRPGLISLLCQPDLLRE